MADITPVTREEFYLAKAGGQDVPVPSAVTREEYYLEKLSNDNVDVPTPVTRREKFLYFACGGDIDLPSEEKMTRLERLIAKAGGMDVSTPTAVTRLEKFWANVEGGGWKTITGVLPLTFTAKGGTAADWTIYGNDDVGEKTVNLFDGNYQAAFINTATNKYSTLNAGRTAVIQCDPNTQYTVSVWSGYNRLVVGEFETEPQTNDTTNILAAYTTTIPQHITITTGANVHYMACYVSNQNNAPTISIVKGSTAPTTFIPYGYQIPLTVSQQGQPDKTVDIYIGDSPLTEGETVSKTSTGVDIELFEGENTVSTTLYNKPAMKIKYK